MSLIVQVGGAGGGGGAPPPPQKGVVITATSHVAPAGASRHPQPPPAHVTQPFSSPSYVEPPQHVVQHHPQPQPQVLSSGLAQRPLTHSPSRHHRHRHGEAISGNRIVVNHHHHLPTQPLPHLPSSPLPILSPSPAGQLVHTSVNSPSLIPQNIPSSLMPRLPLQLPGRHQLTQRSVGHDNNILPPHVFRKLTRQPQQQQEDDIEMTDNHHPPPRRSLMSPKHNRRNFFNNLALQDHNYCAAPPPSPPRSPTPPRSPYTNNLSHGMVAAKHEQVVEDRMTSYIGPASPHYRLKQSIDEAGVGPLTPGDNESFRDRSASDNMEDGGEETETAPEADDEGQDDSVTRCVCDFLHDDGYMIQCDKCSVWQHVVCMGLDKNNIPDEYLCEKCNPRTVDRKKAKALQKAREKEIFAKIRLVNDSSDDDKTKAGLANLEKNRKHFSSLSRKFNGGKKDLGKKLFENKKLLKKTHKKRLLKDNARGQEAPPTSPSKKSSTSPRKNIRRKSLSGTDAETEPEENPGETLSLRSWIDNYEEAVTNHYSPELRARLTGAKISTNFSKAKDVNGIRCNVSLRGNGLKVLTANSFIPSDTPVIECRGKYMLNNPGLIKASKNNPYVLQHKLNNELEVLVDGTTYGNDSRFCRRASPSSGESNAVIRHHLEKGSLHLYIVASRNIEKNQEILLPSLEKKNGIIEEEMSIADELREIKKASGKLMNGNVEGRRKLLNKKRVAKRDAGKKKEEASSSEEEDDERKTEREARIAKEKERLARQREEREKEREKEDKASPRKTRSAAVSDVKEELVTDLKEEVKEEVKEEMQDIQEVVQEEVPEVMQEVIKKEAAEDTKQLTIMIPKEKEESMENSPSAGDPSPVPGSIKSPSKPSLGLPDQSGLIVGVNTINYDVSFRNKTKTREERKMEMIMKAIEAMEKSEARKRNDSEEKVKPEKKRRRSNSTKTGLSGAGESQDQSSADEGYGGGRRQSGPSRGRGRKPGASLSGVRRRSRAKSGDSSAMSETETADEIVGDNNFKYPGAVCEDQDDDVSRQYIRGSRSPPGIANHLLRSAKTDRAKEVPKKPVETPVEVQEVRTQLSEPKTIGCSAKKRWLRAAMSVDMSEGERPFDEGAGASPAQASPEPDYTPLKKRRLATYSNDASEDMNSVVEGLNSPQVSEKIKSLPNGVKKRLMSNLVLEAVLDKAMEDFKMPPGYNDDNALDSNNEETSSPMINDEEMDESESSGKPRSFKDKRKEAIYKAELDRKSANSSESEEATVDAGDVQYKEAPVPGPVNNDPAHDNNDKVPDNENKLEDDVPLEEKEFCQTPLQDEPLENGADEGNTDPAAVVPSQNSQFKSFFSTDLSVEDIDRQLAAKREALVKEAAEEAETLLSSNTSPGSEESRPGSAGAEPGSSSSTPQVKKVMSLADYKKRKQQVGDSSVSSTPASTPTTPTPGLPASLPPLSLSSLPSLPGLDSFSHRRESEILSGQARSRNSSSHRTCSRPNSASNSRSPSRAPGGHKTPSSSPLPAYQEQPREDLTERLRKEFGLNIDESDDADTDGGEVVEREEKVVKEPRERKVVGGREDSRLDSRRDGRDHRPSEQSRVHRRDGHSDKNYKYDKRDSRDYRDSRDSRDSYKSHHRDSRYHDKRPPSHHSGSRRPPHPSSPTNGPARGLHNGGSRRSGSHQNSPTRRNSQESESRYSHPSHSYYKNESSRRNLSRNFYTQ